MPARKYSFSIVTRVFGLTAATLLLVGAGEIVSGVNLRADRQDEVRDAAMQLARIASLHMDRILEGAHDVLATLGKLPEGSRWDARACAVVAATVIRATSGGRVRGSGAVSPPPPVPSPATARDTR